jgi:hypothetical protein
MAKVASKKVVVSIAIAVQASPSWPQSRVIDHTKIQLFNQAAPATSTQAKLLVAPQPAAAQPPPRLTNADYQKLRAHIASILKVPISTLAPSLGPSKTMSSPGGGFNIPLGGPPPNTATGATHWWVYNVSMDDRWENGAVVPASIPGIPAPVSTIRFWTTACPGGAYLVTVYLQTNLASISCRVIAGDGTPAAASMVPVQSGMLLIPVLLREGPRERIGQFGRFEVALDIPWKDGNTRVFSCDFARVH